MNDTVTSIENHDDFLISPIDKEAETNGTWKKFHTAWFLIARNTNEDYKSKMLQIADENQQARENGATLPELEQSYAPRISRLIANYILLDWKGKNARGQELPRYTKELGYKFLMQDPDLRRKIREVADKEQNYYHDAVQKDLSE